MTDQLDAVARAAKRAYDNYVSSTLGETRWTAEWIAESWRVIARAAIDALGLKAEELSTRYCQCGHHSRDHTPAPCSGRKGKCTCRKWKARKKTRLVSPWVRESGDD